MNYLQKKKQAIIMMLAAQIIKTAQGYPVTVNDCESGTAVDYTVWGNTVTGKNLIPYPYMFSLKEKFTVKETNGITFTSNENGTITADGTSTNNAQIFLVMPKNIVDFSNGKSYFLSGCPAGDWAMELQFWKDSTYVKGFIDKGSGTSVQNFQKEWTDIKLKILIPPGTTVSNLIFKPQLELGTTATEYEPYMEKYVGDKTLVSDNTYKYKIPIVNSGNNDREDTLINIYLDKPLKKGESINFGADNLPELQLFEDSNVITADTEAKPEKIVIDYYEKG